MAAAMLEQLPLDEITRRAKAANPAHAILTLITAVLFGLAWCVAKLFRVLWLALAWCYMALDEGWRQAMGTARPAPDIAQLQAEIDRLRAENARLS